LVTEIMSHIVMEDIRPEMPRAVPLAAVVRSGFSEGYHYGRLVVLAVDGSVDYAAGDVDGVFLPRSSNKPMQAAAMLAHGLGSAGEALALAAASHAGETLHIEGVRKILARAGLDEGMLRCPPAWPLDEGAKLSLMCAGGRPERIMMNCSGKHASMLATCAHNSWSTDDYLSPEHPLQRRVRAWVSRLAGEPVGFVAVDGCGAPLFGISLTGLARAFRACVLGAPGSPQRRVADAMRAHPEFVAGTGRLDTGLMLGVPGLLSKGGAEGVQAVALPDGRAAAFKIDDGAARARGPILVAVLRRMGIDAAVLSRYAEVVVTGGGRQVGGIRVVAQLT
jgi:L-asparaginase II